MNGLDKPIDALIILVECIETQFIKDPKIRKTATGEDALRGGLNGNYDASTDILSALLKWTF